MKSKTALETLRAQLHSSLDVFSTYSSSEDITVKYTLEEADNLAMTVDGEDIKAFGLLLMVHQTVGEGTKERRLWLRRYPIKGSLNEVKYQAFKELYDIMTGNFLINASRTDNKTLQELSNNKE